MKKKFINFTNHPSARWDSKQKESAEKYGTIEDMAFPTASPEMDEEELGKLADEMVKQIVEKEPAAVLCQGEFTLAYQVIRRLIEQGITVLAACSQRNTVEKTVDGVSQKTVTFEFVRFREYEEPSKGAAVKES